MRDLRLSLGLILLIGGCSMDVEEFVRYSADLMEVPPEAVALWPHGSSIRPDLSYVVAYNNNVDHPSGPFTVAVVDRGHHVVITDLVDWEAVVLARARPDVDPTAACTEATQISVWAKDQFRGRVYGARDEVDAALYPLGPEAHRLEPPRVMSDVEGAMVELWALLPLQSERIRCRLGVEDISIDVVEVLEGTGLPML